jgi:hypothetical protein
MPDPKHIKPMPRAYQTNTQLINGVAVQLRSLSSETDSRAAAHAGCESLHDEQQAASRTLVLRLIDWLKDS